MSANTKKEAGKTTVTTPSDREVVIERVFDAPRDRVFTAFTDPDLIPQWWGSHEDTTTVDKMEVKPGGDYRFITGDSTGNEQAFRGTFREVTPPERIVQTQEWEGMPGHVLVETIVFEDLGGRTKVTSTSLFHTAEEAQGMVDSGMEEGVVEMYIRLDELLAKSS
jgi:uncharacterized protein YndB with AHSA1/START domain